MADGSLSAAGGLKIWWWELFWWGFLPLLILLIALKRVKCVNNSTALNRESYRLPRQCSEALHTFCPLPKEHPCWTKSTVFLHFHLLSTHVQWLTVLRAVLLITGEGDNSFFGWRALLGTLLISEGARLGCDKIIIPVGCAQGLAAWTCQEKKQQQKKRKVAAILSVRVRKSP